MSAIGINFRQSSNYVADASGETYCLGEVYPITRAGRTFGWSADVTANSRNRSTSVDRRLAGINGVVNTAAKATFTLDLPAPGNYRIRAAFGDQGSAQNILAVIKDGTTTKATINTQPSGGNWTDAAGGVRTSSAAWVSNNQAIDVNFSGTKLNIEFGAHPAATYSSVISHLYVEALDAGDPPLGTVTISDVDPGETSAVVTYSYDDTDQTGFEYRLDGGTAASLGASPATISGLTASTEYDLEVRAINANGAGSWSTVETFTTDAVVLPTVTVTDPLKNNTGTLLASQTGIVASVLAAPTLASVHTLSGLTTNGSGLLAPISHASLTTGQQYHVAIKLADGSVGITGPITAS